MEAIPYVQAIVQVLLLKGLVISLRRPMHELWSAQTNLCVVIQQFFIVCLGWPNESHHLALTALQVVPFDLFLDHDSQTRKRSQQSWLWRVSSEQCSSWCSSPKGHHLWNQLDWHSRQFRKRLVCGNLYLDWIVQPSLTVQCKTGASEKIIGDTVHDLVSNGGVTRDVS